MSRVLFRGGVLVDGTGAEPVAGDVLVVDGRVAAVGTGIPEPDAPGDGTTVVDCTGAFVTPGLFDCHVHFLFEQPTMVKTLQTPFSLPFYEAIDRMRRTVATGVTYVRDGEEQTTELELESDAG